MLLQLSCAVAVNKIRPNTKAFSLVKASVELIVHECKEDKKNKKISCEYSSKGKRVALGSGTFFTHKNQSLFLTAGHVCLGPTYEIWNSLPERTKIVTELSLKSFTGHNVKGKIKYVNLKYDVCVVEATHPTVKKLPRIAQIKPILHNNYYSISAPASIFHTGMVPVLSGTFVGDHKKFSFYTIPTAPGGSGGPIYDKNNNIVGVIQRTHSLFSHIALSIKHKDLLDIMERYFELKNQGIDSMIE